MKTSNHVNRKPSQKPAAQKKKSGGGTLLGIFVGLVIGLAIAFGVVWFLNKSPLPFQDRTGAPRTERAPGDGVVVPAPLPGKPGDKPTDRSADKQRFEFYGMLEGKQPAAPAPAAAPAPPVAAAQSSATAVQPAATAAADARPVETYFLQAGAFQKATDADNLKARLALSGLDASVQEVSIPDKGQMHRVRVGPFKTLNDMNRARSQLSQAGVQTTLIKQ